MNVSQTTIELTQGQHAIVDTEDFEQLNKHKWYANKIGHSYYACRGSSWNKEKDQWNEILRMHRVVLGLKKGDGFEVDHINGDGLDNRRCNLRLVTKQQNRWNQATSKKGTSKYKGVSWDTTRDKWQAGITINGKRFALERFDNEVEAAKAYDKRARIEFKDFARLNFP